MTGTATRTAKSATALNGLMLSRYFLGKTLLPQLQTKGLQSSVEALLQRRTDAELQLKRAWLLHCNRKISLQSFLRSF